MDYHGKLYGKVGGRFFDTGLTTEEYDRKVSPETQNRYFVVFYSAVNKSKAITKGSVPIKNSKGRMFNLGSFNEQMIEKHDFKSILITNFIELSETDYNDLYAQE